MKHMCFFLDKPPVYRPDSLSLTVSVGYTAEILQEFLERVGSYHWAIVAPKGSGIFQEFINMLAVVPQHFCFDCDGCASGSRTERPSRLVSSASTFSALRWECSHAIPHTHTGKPDRHLNFSCTFWDTGSVWHCWRVGRAWARSSTTQTWTDTLHFAVLCLELGGAWRYVTALWSFACL